MKRSACITIRGIVQGVGFRPFLHKLALTHKITGKVYNATGSVRVEARGESGDLYKFIKKITAKKPPAAVISEFKVSFSGKIPAYKKFSIEKSSAGSEPKQAPPDLKICGACKREFFDKNNRRYKYPFINCTDCGPRFTIITNTPYDRKNTTMDKFVMCRDCEREYRSLKNRRYHAEPNACFKCGPSLFLKGPDIAMKEGGEAAESALDFIKKGKIIAVKSIGGFHLACDASNEEAIKTLRQRKKRDLKPFAVMSDSAEKISKFAFLNEKEKKILESPAAPAVLLRKKDGAGLAPSIAPGLAHVAVLAAYTPLHYLLFDSSVTALVMTSANVSDEPVQYINEEAYTALGGIADYFLFHDRDINIRADDSVVKPYEGGSVLIRRSRGYVPAPVFTGKKYRHDIIGAGALMKNTVCFLQKDRAVLSQHIGGLENAAAFDYFTETIENFSSFYGINPAAVASDLHPDYLSTRYAEQYCDDKKIPHIKVQHHYAHLLSVMAENRKYEKAIGVIFDGTGLGGDNTIWGGEFLTGDLNGYKREGSVSGILLPGGDAASKEPFRTGISLLSEFLDDNETVSFYTRAGVNKEKAAAVLGIKRKGINSPVSTGAGRIFDAASSILGVCHINNYDAQAPMELEALAHRNREKVKGILPYEIKKKNGRIEADIIPAVKKLYEIRDSKRPEYLSAVFHDTVAFMIRDTVKKISEKNGIKNAALSGGVFQNTYLFSFVIKLLKNEGFNVLIHKDLSPNDSSIGLGQAVYAAEKIKRG